jgi:hypothetical protein
MASLGGFVRHELFKLADELSDLAKKQVPFAVARSLTDVARLAKGDVVAQEAAKFDRPTPFTLRGPAFAPATKANLRSKVFIKDIQAGYLALQETGGVRLPSKTALVVPAGARLNQYGNLPKGALQRLKGQRNVFIGNVDGIGGVWQRLPGDQLKLLIRFTPEAQYKPKFGYHAVVEARVRRDLPALLRNNLTKALRTARK